jgi:hypothetical protein
MSQCILGVSFAADFRRSAADKKRDNLNVFLCGEADLRAEPPCAKREKIFRGEKI